MRLVHTEITPFIKDAVSIELREQSFLSSPFFAQPIFHAHPELELVYILEGHGKRIIGNVIEPFEPGDMVFIGSNTPHVWLSDPVYYDTTATLRSKAIVAYFNQDIFQSFFQSVKALNDIYQMIQNVSGGICILGDDRKEIAERLKALSGKQGYEKIEGLIRILYLISISPNKRNIITNEQDLFFSVHSDKLIEVLRYIEDNLHRRLTLACVAEIACMAEHSFCRFFKRRTKKRFSRYIEELRISRAKKMLIEDDKPVAVISDDCGYNSSSHFGKVFKRHTGLTPCQFKNDIMSEK